MNLSLIKYELKEIIHIVNFLDNENNELDEQAIIDTKESVALLMAEKSNQLELILKDLELKEEKCKEISRFYAEKSKKFDERKKSLKKMIIETMKSLNLKRIETETGTFTIRNNAPCLVIDDESLIPNQFITIVQTNKIEKNEIKKAIKNGEDVEGVHLENSESLLIK